MSATPSLSTTPKRLRASLNAQRPKIRKRFNKSGSVSWYVDLGTSDWKRHRIYFKTREEAETKADLLKVAQSNFGTATFLLTDKQRVDATEAIKLLDPVNVSLVQACRYYLKHAKPARPLAIKEAITHFLEAKRRAGRRPVY